MLVFVALGDTRGHLIWKEDGLVMSQMKQILPKSSCVDEMERWKMSASLIKKTFIEIEKKQQHYYYKWWQNVTKHLKPKSIKIKKMKRKKKRLLLHIH